jgi:hypothetical protein
VVVRNFGYSIKTCSPEIELQVNYTNVNLRRTRFKVKELAGEYTDNKSI